MILSVLKRSTFKSPLLSSLKAFESRISEKIGINLVQTVLPRMCKAETYVNLKLLQSASKLGLAWFYKQTNFKQILCKTFLGKHGKMKFS